MTKPLTAKERGSLAPMFIPEHFAALLHERNDLARAVVRLWDALKEAWTDLDLNGELVTTLGPSGYADLESAVARARGIVESAETKTNIRGGAQ